MRWKFTWIGGLLRAGERRGSGQALEAEGFEWFRGALFYPWPGLVAGLKRAWGVVEGRREKRL